MKHVLPLLTLALLGTAATAFADNFYYDYYLDPGQSAPQKITVGEGNYAPWYATDTYTYGGSETDVTGDFSVARNSNWYSPLGASTKSNFFRIEVNKDNVELYLTDFVKGLSEDTMQFNSTSNALFNMDIKEYGYRTLTWDEDAGKYIASNETVVKEIFDADGNLNRENVSEIDSITNNNKEVVRYKYSLGTFDKDTVLEIYMRDTSDREVYSFSSPEGDDFVPFDNAEYKQIDTLPGGFGDGGYLVSPIEIDDMLDSYYFPDREEHEPFDPEKTPAAGKAMPLSQLIPINGQPVAFGIIAMTDGVIGGGSGNGGGGNGTAGQPLPGGLQIALIAGLFGLGLWFVRRRKASVA